MMPSCSVKFLQATPRTPEPWTRGVDQLELTVKDADPADFARALPQASRFFNLLHKFVCAIPDSEAREIRRWLEANRADEDDIDRAMQALYPLMIERRSGVKMDVILDELSVLIEREKE
jgi:hypothetical protein